MALTHLLDRTLSETVLYALVMGGLWWARNTDYPFVLGVVGLLTTLIWLRTLFRAIQNERACNALGGGGRAPSIRTWTPFNVGMVINALLYFWRQQDRQFWYYMLSWNKNANHPWTVESITLGNRIVLTIDEENVKAILATKFADFGKGERFRKEWKEFLGLSIFTTDGAMWHDSRSLLRPQFIKDRVSDLETFEHHVQILLPLLEGSQPGATVRADDLFFRFTLDAATAFLLGHSVNSLHNDNDAFARAFADVQYTQAAITRAGPFTNWIPRQKYRAGLRVIEAFMSPFIERALALGPAELERKAAAGGDGNNDPDTGGSYTFLHALAGATRDRTVLRDQIMAVLLAGRDTTAITLSWLFYELARHPTVVAKLRAEIARTLDARAAPTYADLKAMRYLQHTLAETLRLYPVVPDNVRVALRDTTLPRGGGPDGAAPVAVPRDTVVSYSTYALQHRADIYGADALPPPPAAFTPERWERWTPRPWTYIPFNGGPRLCVGQQFALTEMAYTVVRVLQTYARVEPRRVGFPGFRSGIVLQPAGDGVEVAFFRE